MKRRNFLQISGLTPFVVNGFNARPFSNSRIAQILASCDAVRERVLVLIQLKGGNDGVNTIIPIPQYDRYMQLRPTVGIAQGDYIELDTTLPGADQVGLHPAMTGVKALYDKGWASVVQGVGYQSINQSHFKGTDIWLSGGGGSYELNNLTTGWMGRALQAFYPEVQGVPTSDMPDPLGIQLGDPTTSLGFHTETEHQNAINLSGQDPAGFYTFIQTIGGAPLNNIPETDYGQEIEFIMGVEKSINQYAQRIAQVFNAGSNALSSYPSNTFAAQLKTVARLIRGGCKTKIFLCQLGGFDTHSGQVEPDETDTGNHSDLLRRLSDGIKAFFDDLELLGLADQVVACTFSEFGRCAKENGSLGTDHGTLAPMLLFGKNIRAGVRGANVNLSDLTADNQLKNMQFDYRQVFATLLQDWLGANETVLQEALFDSYDKMFLIDKAASANPGCYWGNTPTIYDPFPRPLSLSPNPARHSVELTYNSERAFNARITIHDLSGAVVFASHEAIWHGANLFYVNVGNFTPGMYVVRVEDKNAGTAEVSRLVVVR